MIRTTLIFIGLLILFSCRGLNTDEIYGTWTSLDVVDNTGMNVTDHVVFSKNGKYEMTLYSKGDSVVSRLGGTFKIDTKNQTLIITTKGMTFTHKIKELKDSLLTIETQQKQLMRMKKIR